MAKRASPARRPRLWLVALILLAAMLGGLWWKLAHWAPARTDFPVQGLWLTGSEEGVLIDRLRAEGASFVYVTASLGADGRNERFGTTVESAREAGLQAGPVHVYDPCRRADEQSARFVTIVPRDDAMLAPAVVLDRSGETCASRVRPAELESELIVFLNQIEMHAGKRAILAPTPGFESEYGFGERSERPLWLSRNWLQPGYVNRPWELWTANSALRIGPADDPVAWMVARP